MSGRARTGLAGCWVLATLFGPLAGAQQPPAEQSETVPYSQNGADTCLLCHIRWTTVSQIFDTKHGVPTDARSPFGPGQLQCEACHGPGGLHAGRVRRGEPRPSVIRFAADSVNTVAERNARCLGCHDRDVGFGWHGGPHDNGQVSCADCHTIHAARDPVLATATQPSVCFRCHQTVRTATMQPYSHPIRVGKMSCTSCHSPHGETLELQLVRQTVNETCYQCHAEKRGPFLWEHEPVAEDCTLCHSPHGSNHPGMLVQRAPLLCQSCHSQAGHPSIAQTVAGLPDGAPSAFLLGQSCLNCHSQVHGSNHPSGSRLMR
jgi:DmsE family decaheme c-type cytochrome